MDVNDYAAKYGSKALADKLNELNAKAKDISIHPTELVTESTTVLTSSSLSKFRECPRKYYFSHLRKRAPVEVSESLRFGSAMHEALEKVWNGGDVDITREPINAEQAKINALLSGYDTYHNNKAEVSGIEQVFVTNIKKPDGKDMPDFVYAGKIDVLLKDERGTWVLDHKTTSQDITGYSDYWKKLQVDAQMSWYCMATDAVGFIYDVIKKPTIKLCGKDEKAAKITGITPEEAYQDRVMFDIQKDKDKYYQVREFTKTKKQSADAMVDLRQQAKAVEFAMQEDSFYKNCNSCVGMYGKCSYLGVCSGLADIDDDNLFRDKTHSHEELEID